MSVFYKIKNGLDFYYVFEYPIPLGRGFNQFPLPGERVRVRGYNGYNPL
jgi:hypothetical protein